MEASEKVQWIMSCAQRLTELMPELTQDQADHLSCEVWETCSGLMSARQAAEAEYLHELGLGWACFAPDLAHLAVEATFSFAAAINERGRS